MNDNLKKYLKLNIKNKTVNSFLLHSIFKEDLIEAYEFLKNEVFKIKDKELLDMLLINPDIEREWAKATLRDSFKKNKSGEIYIDDIRKIKEFLNQKPVYLDYKIVFLLDAHKINKEATNSFLKILEEPPNYAFIFLLTTKQDNLASTILSRVVKFEIFSDKIYKNKDEINIEEFLKGDIYNKFDFCNQFIYDKDKAISFLDEFLVYLYQENILQNLEKIKKIVYYKKILNKSHINPQIIIKNCILDIN